jgi:cephalosporin hydroxylase
MDEKDTQALEKAGLEWSMVRCKNRLDYEIEWLGVPIIQTPEDLILMQELVFKVQPDVIIETGIAHGGGLIFYASLMELLGKGKVIGIDIDIRAHNREVVEKHPTFKRIELIQGSSTSDEIIQEVREKVPKDSRVIVFLDSDHTKAHVLKELQIYRQFIMPGCYIVVLDTDSSDMAKLGVCDEKYLDGPKEAIYQFLEENDDFAIDTSFNKLFISTSPDGYLKRERTPVE